MCHSIPPYCLSLFVIESLFNKSLSIPSSIKVVIPFSVTECNIDEPLCVYIILSSLADIEPYLD